MAHARDSLSLWMCEKDMFCVCAVYLRENQHVMEAMNNKTVKDGRELNILYTYTEHHIIYRMSTDRFVWVNILSSSAVGYTYLNNIMIKKIHR